MAEGLIQPIVVAVGLETQLGPWTVDTIGESLVFVPVSILFILVRPRLLLGWARCPLSSPPFSGGSVLTGPDASSGLATLGV